MTMPPLEETFAGNSWRVEERPERGAAQRFVVLGKSPRTFGLEVEICAVQYRPHAEAIAALPEIARALPRLLEAISAAGPAFGPTAPILARIIAKAEGRAA